MITHAWTTLATVVSIAVGGLWLSAGSGATMLGMSGDDTFDQLRERAERAFAEGSYRQALEIYTQAADLELSPSEKRWVSFRIGDSTWRNEAATQTNDESNYDKARKQLQAVLDSYKTESARDELWAMTQRSLGDFWWDRQYSQNWGQGWQHYNQALDFWAGSRDLDKARAMYLDIIFSAAEPSWINNNPWYRQYVQIPANVLDNAVEIAEGDEDRSHAEYLLAMALRQQGGIRQHLRAEELFKSVISTGKTYAWYDDALFYYAEWLSQQGRPTRLESGEWTYKAQYKTAVEQYQHILDEFRKGETAYFDQAKERITSITSPTLNASVGQVYLPGSENQFDVHWRNIGQIDVKMYAVDLTTAIRYPERSQNQEAWVNQIDISGAAIARSMIIDTEDKGDHAPGSKQVRLEEPLEPGAYLLVAAGGGQSARDLLLVSDAAVVLTAVADRTLVYACDAIDGSPLANAAVTLWEVRWVDVRNNRSQYVSKRHEGVTDEHGLAEFKLTMPRGHGQLIATARLEARQALAQVSAGSLPDEGREYRVYAVTDRPAYKPGDDVQWKVTARVYRDSIYETPANQSVKYQVLDPRGSSLKESTLKLNEFGSAWDVLELGTDVALGEYQVQFWTADGNNWIGSATLFRTEEYKLPEFEVTVKPASEDDSDKPRVFQLGDVVDVEIDAQYYFGAPVANADVELVIYQKNFWYRWQEPREYPWLYEDSSREDWRYYDQGQIIKRESLKTDETGKAVVSFETPLNANQDFEYTIEARVVDSSRREVSSSKTVRVTRQKYFVNAKSKHNIHAHGSEIAIEFQARDANSQPVEAEGLVEVFRDEWIEIWITPDGREITGDELAGTRASMRHFPPTPGPNELGWRLKFRGYKSERVLSQKVATDVEGNATFEFTPRQAGYYRITWLSEKLDMYPIRAETAVWVVDDADRAIGYYQGGVEIIVDKDTFHAGQSAPAMISVPTNNRYVLLTVEGNTLHHHQLVHVPGMVKLVTINVTDAMIPNVWLNVAMVDNGQMYTDQAEIVVPPVEHFLTTEVKMNQDNYIPGETGSLTVNTKDHDGHPVSADVTLQVVDESVYTIQQELAGDPREFFFSDRQWQQVQHNSSFGIKPYRKLLENESGDVVWVEDLRADGAPAAPMDDANEALVTDSMENAPSRRTRGESDRMMVDAAMPSAPSASPRPGGGGMGGGGGPESMQMMKQDFQGGDEMRSGGERQNAQPADLSNVRVRSDFRETALWVPSVITDASGTATVDVSFPDSTSRWKVQGRAATTESAFGIAESTVRTRQPLIVRVQAPRFFTVGDETVISAVINNNTDKDQETTIEGKVEGLAVSSMKVKGDATGRDAAAIVVTIPANDSVRIDWNVVADAAGEAIVIVRAGAGEHTDGMERRYT
ncbi:MAG: alpha-2-macroglobulin family protein, partial [Phycisphaerales bacterium]